MQHTLTLTAKLLQSHPDDNQYHPNPKSKPYINTNANPDRDSDPNPNIHPNPNSDPLPNAQLTAES